MPVLGLKFQYSANCDLAIMCTETILKWLKFCIQKWQDLLIFVHYTVQTASPVVIRCENTVDPKFTYYNLNSHLHLSKIYLWSASLNLHLCSILWSGMLAVNFQAFKNYRSISCERVICAISPPLNYSTIKYGSQYLVVGQYGKDIRMF